MNYLLVNGDYLYIAPAGSRSKIIQGLRDMAEARRQAVEEIVGYQSLADRVSGASPDLAILRSSGKFSLTSSLPPEDELDRAFRTDEDSMHIWSGPPSSVPPAGMGAAAIVAAAMRQFLGTGGSRETLHAMVDTLEE